MNKKKNKSSYPDTIRGYTKMIHSGDANIKNQGVAKFIEAMKGFIDFLIKRDYSEYVDKYYDDLFQTGICAILEHIDQYDPNKGKATTFFTSYLNCAFSKYINEMINKSSQYHSLNIKKIKRCIDECENSGIEPTAKTITEKTGLSLDVINNEFQRMIMIDECPWDDSIVAKDAENENIPESKLLEKEKNILIFTALSKLDDLDRKIIMQRFMLNDSDSTQDLLPYEQIASNLSIPVTTVWESIQSSIDKMKHFEEIAIYKEDYVKSISVTLTTDVPIDLEISLFLPEDVSVKIEKI